MSWWEKGGGVLNLLLEALIIIGEGASPKPIMKMKIWMHVHVRSKVK